jgi:hypothetical protein
MAFDLADAMTCGVSRHILNVLTKPFNESALELGLLCGKMCM